MAAGKRMKPYIAKIHWIDAITDTATTLDEFLKNGFSRKISIGWVIIKDKKKIVIATEKEKDEGFGVNMSGDFTMIPAGWVEKIEIIE